MSSADQSSKRSVSPQAEEAQSSKRQKQQQDDGPSDAAPEAEQTDAEATSAASENKFGRNHPRKSVRVSGTHSKWMDSVQRLSTHGNNTGFFSEELKKKGHDSRETMLPDERRRLMKELEGLSDTSESSDVSGLQSCDAEDEAQQAGVDSDSVHATKFCMPVDSPKDAATFLGINLEPSRVSPKSPLELRIDQVQNVALMVKTAEGMLKGLINANDYGTGKSIEALATVFFISERRESQPDFGAHKASIILCPRQALRGWQETHAKYFSSLLTLHICSDSLPKGQHSQKIDPPNPSALAEFLGSLNPSDPQTSRTVIISTYRELSNQEFLVEMEKENIREKELSLKGSTLKHEHIEALEVSQKPELYDLNFNPAMIGTLIADEAHVIKHPTSRRAQATYLLDAEINFLLTASPIGNKISDVRGLLFALYKSNTWQINWPRNAELARLKRLEMFLRMFDQDFDAFKDTGSGNYVPHNASPEYERALRTGLHLWRLNPHAYRWLGHHLGFGPEFSRRVLGSVFHICLLRRSGESIVELPSGESSTIFKVVGLPPVSVRTVQLQMTEHEEKQYYKPAEGWFEQIFDSSAKAEATTAARVINRNEIPLAGFNNFFDTSLSQITADIGLADVQGIYPLSTGPESATILPDFDDLIHADTDAGMSFYYNMTRLDGEPVQPPPGRADMIRHLTRQSPKIRWLLVKLEELRQKSEKTIIFCVHPLTQWFVEGVCAMAEFKFLSIRSKPKHGEQVAAAVIDEFNSPSKRFDFLLSTVRVLGNGVDLHADCHNMIMFELPENIPTIRSAIGRIRRVGQTSPQKVWIPSLDGSYDDYTWSRLSRKYALSLLAFGVLGDGLDRVARRLDSEVCSKWYIMDKSISSSARRLIRKRRRQAMPIREVTKLLAAGDLVRQELGARQNTSFVPWKFRPGNPHGHRLTELSGFDSKNMDWNTRTGRLIIGHIVQPRGSLPFANVGRLVQRLTD
ncbi:hypothetical protein diail_2521 [Diaporthe ilicicola]|nr:hypothetical protein diail_2521 [Diaporthe ilicicola]